MDQRFTRDPEARSASFYARGDVSYIDESDVEEIKRIALVSGGSARYCLHESAHAGLHSMIIAHQRATYTQPKLHRSSAKIYCIVEGEMLVVVFGDAGVVDAVHHLGPDLTRIVRVSEGHMHTTLALTDIAVYHEVVAEPFQRHGPSRVPGSFAPSTDNPVDGITFMRRSLAEFSDRTGKSTPFI